MTTKIELFMVMKNNGHSLYHRCWNDFCKKEINPTILSTILTALKSLGNEILSTDGHISKIDFEEYGILIKKLYGSDMYLVIIHNLSNELDLTQVEFVRDQIDQLIAEEYAEIGEDMIKNSVLNEFEHHLECGVIYPFFPFEFEVDNDIHMKECPYLSTNQSSEARGRSFA